MSLPRRTLLAALGAALISRHALAFGDSGKFVPAVLQHKGSWDARLSGLRRLAWEMQRRTSVEVVPDARPISPSSPRLFTQPFVYLGGDGELPPFEEAEVDNLRRYLNYGGFILADANDGSDGSGFDASFRRELARILPKNPLAVLPSKHVVFKSFYLLDAAPGRLLVKPHFEAAMMGKRAAVLYSQNDLAGAWSRDESGSYEFEVSPGGEQQRDFAFRTGVNVCMYALCLDYKDDAVHLDLIMKKRR